MCIAGMAAVCLVRTSPTLTEERRGYRVGATTQGLDYNRQIWVYLSHAAFHYISGHQPFESRSLSKNTRRELQSRFFLKMTCKPKM
jgi:hypothetical protein